MNIDELQKRLEFIELAINERESPNRSILLERLENLPNVDGILFKDDKKYLEQKVLFEILIRKMLSDEKISILNLDFKDAMGKEKLVLLGMGRLSRIDSELSQVVNSNSISDYVKCFIILKLLETNYGVFGAYLKPFAQKIEPHTNLEENGVESVQIILDVLKRYDPRFDKLFEDLRLDIRGSIAHEHYEILDDGKKVTFKMHSNPKSEYSLIELARINSYQTMMFNFIMVIHSQIQLEYLKIEKTKIQMMMQRPAFETKSS